MDSAPLVPVLGSMAAIQQALAEETERLVALRFSSDPAAVDCVFMDEILARSAARVRRFAVVYGVDLRQVPQAARRFGVEAWRPLSLQFYYRKRLIKVDCGTGDTARLTRPVPSVQQLVDLFEVVYRQALRGKGLAMAPFRL
ncbi:thioredoxin-like U5 snRNP compornent dim1 [Cyanidioschyzon merolae strain 10D]|jgi:DIM1 family U5 snRNP protein|uniref:Thioredoxin-like U5 snRNP compornent dim1 n=1 Tax=Cyanidioschyzon merolae (strain NIES-3377 / 10D) TaxID=280699 RepID=M1V937_CYAM1|nr:thioredoxin-like U5 snRNP compornent dim1 [Cyanidioschyzon merolae strain 10D]BAM81174.1 thioredoxin-like U5 snRNP compornent dim1 [Cyanidioschyzon merolae strain 10D]|eukprot:XP_005537210.1 thioredoxin-like U5 snRNP compornent dim1 [Cyanidioschyzon merolae strain 10D]